MYSGGHGRLPTLLSMDAVGDGETYAKTSHKHADALSRTRRSATLFICAIARRRRRWIAMRAHGRCDEAEREGGA